MESRKSSEKRYIRGKRDARAADRLHAATDFMHLPLLYRKKKWNESRKSGEKRYIKDERVPKTADRLHAATGVIPLPLLI
ncbi:hypothetical protein [Bacillus safensis]|uniref:hypothetical protein n=1 Tax=Bacillus safensis TaxID=561879 RepID=UPI001428A636|nr:hypothetical protein [Bacillus safensis]